MESRGRRGRGRLAQNYNLAQVSATARKALDPKARVSAPKPPARKQGQGDLFGNAAPDLAGIRRELIAILDLLR